jgi:hypothetical protein
MYQAAITGLILIGRLIFGGLIFGWAYIRGGAYIWNEVSVSTCGGVIHGGGAYIRGDYSRRFTVYQHEWKLEKGEIVWKQDSRRVECFHTISSFPNVHEC